MLLRPTCCCRHTGTSTIAVMCARVTVYMCVRERENERGRGSGDQEGGMRGGGYRRGEIWSGVAGEVDEREQRTSGLS